MAKRRRKGKQTDLEDAIKEAKPGPGHNKPELTEDERRVLFFQHKDAYVVALSAKKGADAALKNVCKRAKAELGKGAVADIKDAIAIEEPGGEATLRAEVERKLQVARWMGAPVGTQFSFADDMTPAEDRAFEMGKLAGLKGEAARSPHDPSVPQHKRWMDGWQEGQAAHATAGFSKKPSNVVEFVGPSTADAPFHAPDDPRMTDPVEMPDAPQPA